MKIAVRKAGQCFIIKVKPDLKTAQIFLFLNLFRLAGQNILVLFQTQH